MTYNFPKDIDFRTVAPADVPGIASQLVSIWVENIPIECEPIERERQRVRRERQRAHRGQLIQKHSKCPGFRCVTASWHDDIVGFSYGMYHGEGTGKLDIGPTSKGTHDHLQTQGLVEPEWRDSFDIADLQVLSEYHHRKIGEGLVRILCDRLPPGRVVLSVGVGKIAAMGLYRKLEFQEKFSITPFSSEPTQIVMSRTFAASCLPSSH